MKKKLGILSLLALATLVPTACGNRNNADNDNGTREEDASLSEAKSNAKTLISTYAQTKLQANNVEDDGTVSAIVTRYGTNIDSKTSVTEITPLVNEAKDEIDAAVEVLVQAKEQADLATAKTNKKTELETYLNAQVAAEGVTKEETLNSCLAAGKNAIEAATSIDAVNEAFISAKANIDSTIQALKDQQANQALLNKKTTAKAELDTYVQTKLSDNSLESTTDLESLVTVQKNSIDGATTILAVDEALANAKAAVDNKIAEMKSNSDLSTAKSNAINTLKEYKNEKLGTLTDDGSVAAALATGIENINASVNVEGVNNAVIAAKADIDSKVAAIKAVVDLANAKTNAIASLNEYAQTKLGTLTDDGTVLAAKNSGITAINASTTTAAVDVALTSAKANIDSAVAAIKAAVDLANAKETANTAIEEYAAEKLTAAGITDSEGLVAAKVAEIQESINTKTTINDVNDRLASGKTEIDTLISNLSSMSEADKLAALKESAVNTLNSYAQDKLGTLTDDGSVATAVTNGTTAINSATDAAGVNSALEAAKANVDSRVAALQAAKELAAAKANAVSELDAYASTALGLLTDDGSVELAVTNGTTAINSAADVTGVNSALTAAKANVDSAVAALQAAKELAAAKATAISELREYASTALGTLTDDGSVAQAVTNGTTAINDATNAAGINSALAQAKTNVDNAVSALQAAKELADAKTNALSQLQSYKTAQLSAAGVTDDGSVELAVTNGTTAINAATTKTAVTSALTSAKANIDSAIAVLVANKEAQELATAKENALSELNTYYTSAISGITDDGTVLAAKNNGVTVINAATTKAAVTSALTNAKADIDSSKATIVLNTTIKQYQADLETYANNLLAEKGFEDSDGSVAKAVTEGKLSIGSQKTTADALNAFNSAKTAVRAAINKLDPNPGIINTLSYDLAENETISLEWVDLYAEQATVEYKLSTETTWTQVDEELVRDESGKARVDIVGLKGNATYDVLVHPGQGGTDIEYSATVSAYDRAGYAHFNYTKGVGAYNDDGTLKDNAIVLYVTDDNKNTITLSYGGKTVTGIGNILNTAGMDTGSGTTSKGGKPNTNQDILKTLADNNIPLVVRFIGTVSNSGLYTRTKFYAPNKPLIDGLTIFNSLDNGGSAGDNGHMARMKSGKDITLEGIGADATIDGWGFHFMCSTTDKDTGRGTSFETRNLTFINTPEDAVGMEGTQGTLKADGTVENASSATADILGSVERCWVHDCEFYCPDIDNPGTDSDKAQGDGSVDFKRGQYFTCSYNYFEGCHKTNLVGSSDSSLQFNITYHHNYWKECGARGPLARRANIHMYNNIFEGQTDYCMNPRAAAYIFSEYNMFYKCKNPQDVAGGALKSYNDNFASCIGSISGTIVTNKSTAVSNSCEFSYRGINYSKFELDSSLSYIPGNNYGLEEDFTELRKLVVSKAGALDKGDTTLDSVTLSDCSVFNDLGDVNPTTITTPFTAAPGKISKTIYAFTVNTPFSITVSMTAGVLVNEAGEALLTDSGTIDLLPAGTYAIQPNNFNCKGLTASDFKEVTISSISVTEANSAELDAQRIAEYNTLVSNIPSTITYSTTCYNKIKSAMDAYNKLGALKSQVDYTKVESAYNQYVALGKAEIEGLINSIGTVTKDSYSKIAAARSAYDNAIADVQNKVTNLSTLTAAETAFEAYAAENVKDLITALADPSTATTKAEIESLLAEYNSVLAEYNKLTSTQQAQVTNASKLTNGISTLESAYAPYDVIDLIDAIDTNITLSSGTAITAARTAYDKLTSAQKALVTNYDKLTAAEEEFNKLAAASVTCTFEGSPSNSAISVSGNYGSTSATINGESFTKGLKMESSTSLTFTTSTTKTLTLYVTAGQKIKVDGTSYTVPSDGILVIENLAAGSHTISKDTTNTLLYKLILA